ncbi:MAG: hypothetical protein H0X11_13985 [Betaproteobacteria bacterium]|nr:hypothetical protein [Betaproteobacteria bacterium]
MIEARRKHLSHDLCEQQFVGIAAWTIENEQPTGPFYDCTLVPPKLFVELAGVGQAGLRLALNSRVLNKSA